MSINKHLSVAAPTAAASLLLDGNSSRIACVIQNVGAVDVYLGPDNTVTASGATRGLKLAAGATLTEEAPSCSTDSWYAITASGTGDLQITEVF